MTQTDLLIHNADIVSDGRRFHGWLTADADGMIAATGEGHAPQVEARRSVDADGALLLPGVIDEHVHLRDPGMTHKGDMATETRAALAGGVTSVIDMPNTRPATTTIAAWEAKMQRAAAASACNYAFYLGATNSNLDELRRADYRRVPGVKLFLGSSTGNMLVDSDDTITRIFREIPALIAVHAEDEATIAANRRRFDAQPEPPVEQHRLIRSREACLKATRRAVELARKTGARLHVMHISTADELTLFSADAPACKRITAETCPSYLTFGGADDYRRLGARIKCNPAIKEAADRDALRRAVADGVIDTIATDHAPHLLAEKQGGALTAMSGMPMLQFSLPLMLTLADDPDVPFAIEDVVRVMAHNPATIYGIDRRGFLRPGYHADLTLVCRSRHTVADADVIGPCGWTPLAGMTLGWRVARTWVNGRDDGSPGVPLQFSRS